MPVSVPTVRVAVPAVTATLICASRARRRILLISVSGANPACIKFGSAPTGNDDGHTLDPGAAAGAQGGSINFVGDDCPSDVVYAYSTSGTTVVVSEGA